ncbi:hypothetical protein DXG01_004789 [Tephrocybe rancida]|nr:hypothetical protein DXG01_004789 [Tephrocybe rancida]
MGLNSLKKSFTGGKAPAADKPAPEQPEPPSKGAGNALGQIRDAVPGAEIETAIGYIPGGGLATSGFKAAKGLGGLGFAVGSAGATAVQKKRRKSKAGAENNVVPVDSTVDEIRPNDEAAPVIVEDQGGQKVLVNGVNGVSEPQNLPKTTKISQAQNEDLLTGPQGHSGPHTTYITSQADDGVPADTGYIGGYTVPGLYSHNDLPPVTNYNGIQQYSNLNDRGPDNLGFTRGDLAHNDHANMQPLNDFAPSSEIIHATHQLDPVVHQRVRRVEVEEITRQIIHDRHIHHVQHHTQPVLVREYLEEKHSERVHPPTTVYERHTNNADDMKTLDNQVRSHGNTMEYLEPEHIVVDKGSTIQENVHHHVHHIIQPVLEKESVDQHRIHTSVPVNESTHDTAESVNGITGKDGMAGKYESMIPGSQVVSSPAGHCKGCNCGEMNRLSETFGQATNISDSPVREPLLSCYTELMIANPSHRQRQDSGPHANGIFGDANRKNSFSVL